MAIIKELTISAKGDTAKLSKDVYLYLGDGGITLLITVLETDSTIGRYYKQGTNIVVESGTTYAQVCILKANNEVVYSDRCQIEDGKIVFEISKDFIDEIAEQGTHLLQIHLFDSMEEDANRLTIPPVTFTILQPICDIGHDLNIP